MATGENPGGCPSSAEACMSGSGWCSSVSTPSSWSNAVSFFSCVANSVDPLCSSNDLQQALLVQFEVYFCFFFCFLMKRSAEASHGDVFGTLQSTFMLCI